MDTLFDYLDGTPIALEPLAEEAARERLDADRRLLRGAPARRSNKPAAARPTSRCRRTGSISPKPNGASAWTNPHWRGCRRSPRHPCRLPRTRQGRQGMPSRSARAPGTISPPSAASPARTCSKRVTQARRRRCRRPASASLIALWSEGSRERMAHVLAEHGLLNLTPVASWPQALGARRARRSRWPCSASNPASRPPMSRSSASRTFSASAWCARAAQSKRAENFIAEVTSLVRRRSRRPRRPRHRPLRRASQPSRRPARRTIVWKSTITAATSCFCRSRTSNSCRATARKKPTSSLTGSAAAAWQARKARMKNRIREIAGELIKIAAERQLREAPLLAVGAGLYDEFCAGFPYEETDDQDAAIAAVLNDLAAGRPMDRLICGDVGFGKTEIALRAAFIAAMNGKQVAIVVPTTLLVAPALQDVHRPAARLPGPHRASLATRLRARNSPRPKRASPTAPSTSSSAPTRCSARPSSSRTSASSSSTRSSISASRTRRS